MTMAVTPRGADSRVKDSRGPIQVRSAFELARLGGRVLPSNLHFDVDPPAPDPVLEARFKALEDQAKAANEAAKAADARAAKAEAAANAANAKVRKEEEGGDDEIDPKTGEKKPVKKSKADKDLDQRLAKIEQKDEKVTKNAKRNGLKTAFSELGITGDDQADAVDLFMSRNGDNLVYDEETDSVVFKEGETETPLTDYIKAQAKAGKYKRFKAVPKLPGVTPEGDGQLKTSGEMTMADFKAAQRAGKIPYDQLEKIKIIPS